MPLHLGHNFVYDILYFFILAYGKKSFCSNLKYIFCSFEFLHFLLKSTIFAISKESIEFFFSTLRSSSLFNACLRVICNLLTVITLVVFQTFLFTCKKLISGLFQFISSLNILQSLCSILGCSLLSSPSFLLSDDLFQIHIFVIFLPGRLYLHL